VTIEAENKAEGKKAMKEFAKKFEITKSLRSSGSRRWRR